VLVRIEALFKIQHFLEKAEILLAISTPAPKLQFQQRKIHLKRRENRNNKNVLGNQPEEFDERKDIGRVPGE
jgi:hypothetical protein